MTALCCILNYNVNENANYLYNEFNKYCEAHVIDSDSKDPYPYFENVGNNYYTGLFNHSIKKFKEGNYTNLIIITSDIIMSEDAIKYTSYIANRDMGDIGIMQLQTDPESRSYYNPYKYLPSEIRWYDTSIIEGFFNILHHDVAMAHEWIPYDVNKIGVCIDKYTYFISKKLKKRI